ncbi:MAG: flavoprotein [Actinomycetota bacterium]|nr:flavoprotein [Actinomycetota bacterium]
MNDQATPGRVLYVVACATPAAAHVGTLVGLAQAEGWTVCIIATPSALRFIDCAVLETQTGYPVRSQYKQPGTDDVLPAATAIVVGGASFNTINKWAAGIADNLALGLLTEGIGLGLPLVVLPFLNAAQAAHSAFGRSVDALREVGVAVLLGEPGYEPHMPHEGSKHLEGYPWERALEAIDKLQDGRSQAARRIKRP